MTISIRPRSFSLAALMLLFGCTGGVSEGSPMNGNGAGNDPVGNDNGGDDETCAGCDPGGGDAGVDPNDPNNPEDPMLDPMFPADGFCNEGGAQWAYCEDFDGRGMNGRAALDPATHDVSGGGVVFSAGTGLDFNLNSNSRPIGVSCGTSGNCDPYFEGGALHTNAEEGGFGMALMRPEQPFDFAGREGHIHFTTDHNSTGRMNVVVHISPFVSTTMPDTRLGFPGSFNSAPGLTFVSWKYGPGTNISGKLIGWKDGFSTETYEQGAGVPDKESYEIDLYVSRTSLRFLIDGQEIWNRPLQDIGFDRAYVYFGQLAYNPMKQDGAQPGAAFHTVMWDNLAFDGPVLTRNWFTPEGSQDVVFRVGGASACTVRGVTASGASTMDVNGLWTTWQARLPMGGAPVTLGDINCTPLGGGSQFGMSELEIITR